MSKELNIVSAEKRANNSERGLAAAFWNYSHEFKRR